MMWHPPTSLRLKNSGQKLRHCFLRKCSFGTCQWHLNLEKCHSCVSLCAGKWGCVVVVCFTILLPHRYAIHLLFLRNERAMHKLFFGKLCACTACLPCLWFECFYGWASCTCFLASLLWVRKYWECLCNCIFLPFFSVCLYFVGDACVNLSFEISLKSVKCIFFHLSFGATVLLLPPGCTWIAVLGSWCMKCLNEIVIILVCCYVCITLCLLRPCASRKLVPLRLCLLYGLC